MSALAKAETVSENAAPAEVEEFDDAPTEAHFYESAGRRQFAKWLGDGNASAQQIARRCGVSEGLISMIRSGKRPMKSYDLAMDLYRYAKIDPTSWREP